MARKKSQTKSQPRKQEPNIFTETKKLVDAIIKAYRVGGMALTLVSVGLIGLIFTFLFKSTLDTISFIAFIIVCVILFSLGVYIYYLKEIKK